MTILFCLHVPFVQHTLTLPKDVVDDVDDVVLVNDADLLNVFVIGLHYNTVTHAGSAPGGSHIWL